MKILSGQMSLCRDQSVKILSGPMSLCRDQSVKNLSGSVSVCWGVSVKILSDSMSACWKKTESFECLDVCLLESVRAVSEELDVCLGGLG